MRTITSVISKNEYLYRVFKKRADELSGWWFVADVVATTKAEAIAMVKKEDGCIYKAKELEVWESRNLK